MSSKQFAVVVFTNQTLTKTQAIKQFEEYCKNFPEFMQALRKTKRKGK